ncbi:hypothetical protein [Sorangium sp. So ce887]|uniref:hypothetical protein n=1 Tax=Sorangium sp. So ce887 TaxID=3133324 RepID=UPI003F5F2CB2
MRPGVGGEGPRAGRDAEELAMAGGQLGEGFERGAGQEPAFRVDAALIDQRARLVDRNLAADAGAPQVMSRLSPRDAMQPRLERAADRPADRGGTCPTGWLPRRR